MRSALAHFLCSAAVVYPAAYYPKTHNPLTHTCLRMVAIANIIKGAGIQFPVLSNFMAIDPEVNSKRLACGTALLVTSHLLHFLEHIEHPEYHQTPSSPSKNHASPDNP